MSYWPATITCWGSEVVLHTLNASADSSALRDCLAALGPNDALLLIGDGAYTAIPGTPACQSLLNTSASLYVLDSAAAARGITTVHADITVVDGEGFVELSERFPRHMAWY